MKRNKKQINAKAKKYIMIFSRIMIVLIMFGFYMLGRQHGMLQTAMYLASEHCDLLNGYVSIYPYGCEHENLMDTSCAVMDCQAIGLNLNGAICSNFTEKEISRTFSIAVNGLGLMGCPLKVYRIGINPITHNRSWAIKGEVHG